VNYAPASAGRNLHYPDRRRFGIMFKTLVLAVSFAAATTLVAGQGANTQLQNSGPETFTAFAVDISSTAPRATASAVDIHVDRYSPDADRDRLKAAFKEKGQDGLLSELQKLPVVGYIRTPQSLRYDVHFARQVPQAEGGRKIVLLTDRHMAMWEVANQARSVDYPFTLVELQLDKDSTGVGKASIATKITQSDDGAVELENWSDQPVRLNEVRKTK
jgi:hypothetical protein